ncbi:hypothetical protein AB9F45_35160, partial [Rhizobium leguminosarum]|uniref:hypothetical protein n=1 Tax=Rhizobium leguminosarum TaxID=384 RepID=UPI003F96F6D6
CALCAYVMSIVQTFILRVPLCRTQSWCLLCRRKKRLKAFGDAMKESIRKHIVTLNKKRRQSLQQIEEDRLLDDFDEQ